MLKWAIIFAIVSVVAGVFGFTGISAGAAKIAKILFFYLPNRRHRVRSLGGPGYIRHGVVGSRRTACYGFRGLATLST